MGISISFVHVHQYCPSIIIEVNNVQIEQTKTDELDGKARLVKVNVLLQELMKDCEECGVFCCKPNISKL